MTRYRARRFVALRAVVLRAAGLRAAVFLAAGLRFAAVFFAGAFLAAAFLAAGLRFAGAFLATAFLAATFLAAGLRFAAVFFAGAFLAATFLAAGLRFAAVFFLAAGIFATFRFLEGVLIKTQKGHLFALTSALNPDPALKLGTVVAAIFISSPVWGLRPTRAARSDAFQVPKPGRVTCSFLATVETIVSVNALRHASTLLLGSPVCSAAASISSVLFTVNLQVFSPVKY